ncbi:MAG: hypothetical protein CM1200mP30_07640 [Pseudomonadota bacterium]|nr:MAG: hypothetical protein CM1200mP30_07640 [Pseudomonadota bacterium]
MLAQGRKIKGEIEILPFKPKPGVDLTFNSRGLYSFTSILLSKFNKYLGDHVLAVIFHPLFFIQNKSAPTQFSHLLLIPQPGLWFCFQRALNTQTFNSLQGLHTDQVPFKWCGFISSICPKKKADRFLCVKFKILGIQPHIQVLAFFKKIIPEFFSQAKIIYINLKPSLLTPSRACNIQGNASYFSNPP